jgi:hypothetical protein
MYATLDAGWLFVESLGKYHAMPCHSLKEVKFKNFCWRGLARRSPDLQN